MWRKLPIIHVKQNIWFLLCVKKKTFKLGKSELPPPLPLTVILSIPNAFHLFPSKIKWSFSLFTYSNLIGGVIVSVLASSVVHRGFESRSGQTKDYEIGICCFSAEHAALVRKSKDWLARNQHNMSEWGNMSISDCCFSNIKIQLSVLV